MEDEEQFPRLYRHKLDLKKYRKGVRKKFDHFHLRFRLKKFKEPGQKYLDQSKEIQNIVFRCLNKEVTYETGNIYFLFGTIDSHFAFFQEMISNVVTEEDEFLRNCYYDIIFDKNEKLIKLLKENETNPITSQQLVKYFEESEND